MRTVLVDCYLQDSESKMIYYRQMIKSHSDIVEVKLCELKSDFDLSGIDAVVLSGSQWMISETEPDRQLQEFIRQLNIPTLGICFGHQLLARSFGAVVKKGELIEREEKIRINKRLEIFAGFDSAVVMRESHQEYVTPESILKINWQIGAESDSCPVEAIRHPQLPIYGVQFHPERSKENGEKLFANFYHLVLGK